MRIRFAVIGLLGLLLFVGCAQPMLEVPGEISGIVFDVDGNVVRGARVYLDSGPETTSNSSGSYVLRNVTLQEVKVKASIRQDGIDYYGEQYVPLFDGERSKSANVTVIRNGLRATVTGTVKTQNGTLVRGARIFANAGTQSSTYAVTGQQGTFRITTLQGNVQYTIIASARGYDSAVGTVTVAPGDTTDLLFTLGNEENAAFNPPQNPEAIAWTSPDTNVAAMVPGRDPRSAYEQIKRLSDPKREARMGQRNLPMTTAFGNSVEIDLDWDSFSPDAAILGFNVYRRSGVTSSFVSGDFYDFLRDPVATFYSDLADNIHENQTYSYALSTINVTYPDGSNSESSLSTAVNATTLADMLLNPVTFGPLTFNWQGGSGATTASVYVFDRYPGVGVDPIWVSSAAAGNSRAYGGPALTTGHLYYYLVLGLANGNTSRTISPVDFFLGP